MKIVSYTKMPSKSLSNLHIANVDGSPVGFIFKPKDTKSDKNFWRSYIGIGDNAKFLGHSSSKQSAMTSLNWAVMSENATVAAN